MVLKEAGRRIPPALQLLLWCLALTLLVQLEFWRVAPGAPPSNPFGLSPIYWTLIQAFDAHGDWLLLAIAAFAFAMRRHESIDGFVRFAGERPWMLAAGAFVALSAASFLVGRGYQIGRAHV